VVFASNGASDAQRDLPRLDHEVGLLQHTEKLLVERITREVDTKNKIQVGQIARNKTISSILDTIFRARTVWCLGQPDMQTFDQRLES
jgi:hypothetical protein